jgi:hypothetical protein
MVNNVMGCRAAAAPQCGFLATLGRSSERCPAAATFDRGPCTFRLASGAYTSCTAPCGPVRRIQSSLIPTTRASRLFVE